MAPTDEEIAAAALQFVRKVSGYRVPSRTNQPAFDQAVADVAVSTRVLLASLTPAVCAPHGELRKKSKIRPNSASSAPLR